MVNTKKFNPFSVYGVTDYDQYKEFPFLQTDNIKQLTAIMNGKIRDNFRFPERMILLGDPGIGKTTSLFYCHDLLQKSEKCNVFIFSKFFVDEEDFNIQTGVKLSELIKKNPTYILVDFPDTIAEKNFKMFLDFCWNLMTRENYKNINLLFAMNKSHFDRSFSFSEILGKFYRHNIDRLTKEESAELIKKRLETAGMGNFFEEPVYDLIFDYSKGIPRNIICASRTLVDSYFNHDSINYRQARNLLKGEYIDKILNDRVENRKEREIMAGIMKILTNDFHDKAVNQTELLKEFKRKLDIGKNRGMEYLTDLYRYGLVEYTLGGRNNVEKMWVGK